MQVSLKAYIFMDFLLSKINEIQYNWNVDYGNKYMLKNYMIILFWD